LDRPAAELAEPLACTMHTRVNSLRLYVHQQPSFLLDCASNIQYATLRRPKHWDPYLASYATADAEHKSYASIQLLCLLCILKNYFGNMHKGDTREEGKRTLLRPSIVWGCNAGRRWGQSGNSFLPSVLSSSHVPATLPVQHYLHARFGLQQECANHLELLRCSVCCAAECQLSKQAIISSTLFGTILCSL